VFKCITVVSMLTGDAAKDGVLVYQGDGNYLRGCHHCDKQSHQGHDWQGTEAGRMSVGILLEASAGC